MQAPLKAWTVTFAGTAVNLCLGILYAWSVWKSNLTASLAHPAGTPMEGLNAGWSYLTDAEATWAYTLCGFLFAVTMIPGGKIQDRFGPRIGAIGGGIFLAIGCLIAGFMQSYAGLLIGFGVCGGIGMGFGYAAATPAAVKWFGPHQRGLIVGIVVGGYGAGAIYISPFAKFLIAHHGLSGSFIGLGIFFALVVIVAGSLLSWPPAGYVPPGPPANFAARTTITRDDWAPREMIRTWQFYALVFLFLGSAQSGLLVIANATPLLNGIAGDSQFLKEHAWLLPAYVGLVNALGRVGTGFYSDLIGRANAYVVNSAVSAAFILLMPTILASSNVAMLFAAVGVAAWQYGGGLSLMPSLTADYFGSKNLGMNYGLVFLGWGAAFFVPLLAGYIKDLTESLNPAFYLSGALLVLAVALSKATSRPIKASEAALSAANRL
jgi:OFA family oxalate/formate antiporter-like MFS transporter